MVIVVCHGEAVEAACKPCRDHRNKRVSHKGLELFTNAISIHDPMMKTIDNAGEVIHRSLHDIRVDLDHGSMNFDYPDGESEAEKLIEYLGNRASQKDPAAVSIITYDSEFTRCAFFYCAFCGEKIPMPYYRDGAPSREEIARWHWSTSHSVVGFEQLAVETVDLAQAEPTTLSLST